MAPLNFSKIGETRSVENVSADYEGCILHEGVNESDELVVSMVLAIKDRPLLQLDYCLESAQKFRDMLTRACFKLEDMQRERDIKQVETIIADCKQA